MSFCHLHNHTEYSQLDGVGTPRAYARKAKELGFEYLAITDHGNVDGAIQFQKACKEEGIKPVIGCEMYIVPYMDAKHKGEKRGHVTVLVKNLSGWKSLLSMLTKANLKGFYHRPRTDFESVLELDLSGLIFMTACAGSFLHLDGGPDFLCDLCDKTDCYYEIMPHNIPAQKRQHDLIKSLEYDLPFVATNDCHYINRGDWQAQEVLLAINRKAKWSDQNRFKFGFRGLHLRSEKEMIRAFEKQDHWPDTIIQKAMDKTIKIAEQCADFVVPKQDISLPEPPNLKADDDLNLKKLIEASPRSSLLKQKAYQNRYDYEFDLISRKGFSRYFLIVIDLIHWCRDNDIMVGPGRGSVGGSLIAYILGITETDPIQYGLYFSRFISDDRLDYPDIDIDFEDRKRGQVIEYLEKTYGKYNTAGISTFLRMKDRGIIHDVGRVFEVPYKEVNEFAKTIQPFRDDMDTLEKVFEMDEGQDFKKQYPEVSRNALKLKGQIRGAGQHAAAVVISNDDLRYTDRCNLSVRSNRIMVNWSMEDSEYCGLMKLDILGLNTLSVLSQCKKLIGKKDFKFSQIPLDDKDVFKMLSDGITAGVFQLSAKPSTKLCQDVGVNEFADIPAILALVRPGPFYSGMTEEYIERKKGDRWEPDHPIYEEITKETYGLLVYQEQVMAVISKLAGLPETTADKIRKIIAKKRDLSAFEEYKKMFICGCLRQKTFSRKRAEEFWHGLLEWASYGFNKAHATEYGLISYWTAWLKYHYPAEFMAAELTYGTGKEDIANEARETGLQMMSPKIGISDAIEWRVDNRILYAPFTEIKGIGEKAAYNCMPKKAKLSGFFDDSEYAPINVPQGTAKILDIILAHDKKAVPEQDILDEYFEPGLFQPVEQKIWIEQPYISRIRTKMVIGDCKLCGLRNECNAPVNPSPGIYNAAIIGEAPGPDEDEAGKGFVGASGQLIWPIFKRYGYSRRQFHISNICKCYPSKTGTPKPEHIKACMPYLRKELTAIKCKIALVFGNIGLSAFTEQKGGITKLSGTTQYLPEYDMVACWCVHPSWVLRDRRRRIEILKDGISNFINTIDDVPF